MPRSHDPAGRRAEFAEAACEMVAHQGLKSATVRAVALRAGASTGRLVHYFRSKDELLLAALRHAAAKVSMRMAGQLEKFSGLAALRAICLEALPLNGERRREWRVWLAFWGRAATEAALAAEHERRNATWHALVLRILHDAHARGELGAEVTEDLDFEAEQILAFIDGLGVQALFAAGGLSEARLRQHVDALIARLSA